MGVDLKLEPNLLSRMNTIGLALNLGFDPAPSVAEHAALRLL